MNVAVYPERPLASTAIATLPSGKIPAQFLPALVPGPQYPGFWRLRPSGARRGVSGRIENKFPGAEAPCRIKRRAKGAFNRSGVSSARAIRFFDGYILGVRSARIHFRKKRKNLLTGRPAMRSFSTPR